MATLNNTDRNAVIGGALKASFEPRFNALRLRMNEHLKQYQQENHPHFIKLASDKETLRYLQYLSCTHFTIPTGDGGAIAARPNDWEQPSQKPERWERNTNTKQLSSDDLIITSKIGSQFCIKDAGIISDYHQIWHDLDAAREKLTELLHSYRAREKFAEAFPDLAKHLPPARTPSKLPAVIIDDVRTSLASLGIAA